ncbi:penicillin acylase family protein [Donghicola eburneus]|uniref:Peptidase S45 penicillin amidase n=1 Tax=Donghicola eburneus TaxID=393278 RepID=A0A1M4MYX5_9RHOB|nr:penicillin acylase family protein [Donghicola eburneus]SCM67782.1 peptidase S45 penicillin amidase [Donghicola eburneus]SFQ76709.1 penicillin amidase [Donghicola eburneus]
MKRVFKWLLRLTVASVVAATLAVLAIYYLAARSLPDYSRDIQLSGAKGEIEIVRDTAAVPHIFADDDFDVFFGLGYAQAQDRLWQIVMMRRTAQGRLSELFGERTLPIDRLMRQLDLYNLAARSVEVQTAEARIALDGYAAGVNARLREINEKALGRGAPEMFLFPAQIAPWTPADSLAVLKLMSVQLSGHLEAEVLRAQASMMLTPERVKDILPDVPGEGIAALPEYAALFDAPLPALARANQVKDPLSPFPEMDFAGASNAFVASDARSAAGGALLANDPHLGFSAPTIWYLARLELQSGGVIGGTIPGIPLVLSGRSEKLGWGLTSSYLDDQDLFIEEVNPDNPDEYRVTDGYAPFTKRPSIINIKGQSPQTFMLRWTRNGPVMPPEHYNLGSITPRGHVAALSWTMLTPNDTSFSAAFDIMQAQSVPAAITAAEDFIAPSQNLSLADAQGNIGLKLIGAMPRRLSNHQSKGRMPSPGWLNRNRWRGRLDYHTSNPEFLNPEGGILGNTNNKIVDRPFPEHVSFEWGDTERVQRFRRLMQARKVHTRESFIEAQLDTVSITARTLLPLIGADLWFTGEAAAEGTPERTRQLALEMLAGWNGEMNEHMPEPLIYAAWLRELQDRLIRDELGPLAGKFTHVEPLFIERVYRDIDGAAEWCNVRQSAKEETCAEMARLALDDALIWISETYGTKLQSLRWGDAHQATHDHQVLGELPVLRYFVNIRQSTSGGDDTLLRGLTKGSGPDPFLNVHGAGYRGVYDFADPESSVFVTSTGQSGHFLSRHYDDLGVRWRLGEYVPMALDPELARAANLGITTITPQ